MDQLLRTIRLSQSEIETASRANNYLGQILVGKAGQGLLPTPLSIFLTGSYKRGTKISPLNDVDVFYVIGKAIRRDGYWHSILNCDFNFGQDYLDLDANISSIKVLGLLKKELVSTYPNSDLQRNGEVVNLYLDSYGLGLDIVPAFEVTNASYYLIPNGSNSTKWKKSNPHIDVITLENLNKIHNGLLKDIICITKYWFKKKKIRSPRSYHLEASIYHVFSSLQTPVQDHVAGLVNLLTYIHPYLSNCPDPTGLSDTLTSGLTDEDLNNIATEATRAISYLTKGNEDFIKYVEGN